MREMRRKDRLASPELAIKFLEEGEYGVMATVDADNMPYAVPMSYAYHQENNCIYLHCALDGHKLDNIKHNPKVSFCVVGPTEVYPDKFSTDFESTIVFGNAQIIENQTEKVLALRALIDKYSKAFQKEGMDYIQRAGKATCALKINIEHMSGKKRVEQP